MKRLLLILVAAAISLQAIAPEAAAQDAAKTKFVYTDGTELTLVGRIAEGVPNIYHRIDVAKYDGLSEKDVRLLKCPTGLALAFKTNSPEIRVCATVAEGTDISPDRGRAGFDLYIRQDGKWLWAHVAQMRSSGKAFTLIQDMDGTEHECLMYLPISTSLETVSVGVAEGSTISALPYPFGGGRILVYGSSFTQGSGTTRPGQTYCGVIQRRTGLDILNAGMGGDCFMQPAVVAALNDASFDAFVIDAFSNGSPSTMKRNMFAFIETIQASHPGVPIIFQRTIYRERRNFNTKTEASETAKRECADSLLEIALKKYKDVYVIDPNATDADHDTSVDGTHPSEYGYHLWADSIIPQLRPILARYGISL